MLPRITSSWTKTVSLAILLLPGLLSAEKLVPDPQADFSETVFTVADFSMALDSKWDTTSFKGNTHYERLRLQEGGWALKAVSMNSASLLRQRLKIRPEEFPIVRWRWRVEELPRKGNESKPGGDDAAARLLLKSICFQGRKPSLEGEIHLLSVVQQAAPGRQC